MNNIFFSDFLGLFWHLNTEKNLIGLMGLTKQVGLKCPSCWVYTMGKA